jgi:hypothetical protein
MIFCKWIIICQQSIANQETNNISLIEVLEEISIPPPPSSEKALFLDIDLDVVTSWRKNDNQENDSIYKIQFIIVAPSGETLLQGEPYIKFPDTSKSYGVFKLNGLPVSGSGDYKFQIKVLADDDTEIQKVETLLQVRYEQVEDQLENSSITQFNLE